MFNPAPATVMHVDINSCFATIEQQANPALRGRPTVVAAYAEDHGCILAASREAKKIGITTGMRVWIAKSRCPYLTVLAPDPDKYRFVNKQLHAILNRYSSDVSVESIDEMVLDLAGSPQLRDTYSVLDIAREIKRRVKTEIGEWISVSIGIAPNRYLAKVASGLHKPDGLDVIDEQSLLPILSTMTLEDLCGVKSGNATRLRIAGIYTPILFATADSHTLERAFHSIVGRHWWMRFHGYEDGSRYTAFGSEASFAQGFGGPKQKSFGHAHALGTPLLPTDPALWKIVSQLVVKMGSRLRAAGFMAQGVGISLQYADYSDHWHTQESGRNPLYADTDFYNRIARFLKIAPSKPIRIPSVYCYHLSRTLYSQQSLFEEDSKKEQLTRVIDSITARFGPFTVTPARMLAMNEKVLDRISFGKV